MGSLTATAIQRDIVIVGGADAAQYLQTQLTQDVDSLQAGQSTWSFLLAPKSGIEFMLRVTRSQTGDFILDVETSYGAALRSRLDGLLFRMDVLFEESHWPGVALRGPGAVAFESDAPVVATLPWQEHEAVDLVGPNVSLPDGVATGDAELVEQVRLDAGWPAMGTEIHEDVTPSMTGLVDKLVAFDKGCYTGQEFVARVYFRGAKPPRRLVQLISPNDEALDADCDIRIEGNAVGIVTSAAGSMGLGYLKRSVETPGEVFVNGVLAEVFDVSD